MVWKEVQQNIIGWLFEYLMAEKREDSGKLHCTRFNDVYDEVDIKSRNKVIIGQMDGSRLDVCISGVYGFKLPRIGPETFEKIVEGGW